MGSDVLILLEVIYKSPSTASFASKCPKGPILVINIIPIFLGETYKPKKNTMTKIDLRAMLKHDNHPYLFYLLATCLGNIYSSIFH